MANRISKVLLDYLRLVGAIAIIVSGGYLMLLTIWLLSGGKYLPKVNHPSNVYVKVFERSIFDDNNWIKHLPVNRIVIAVGILIVAIALLRFCSLKSSAMLK